MALLGSKVLKMPLFVSSTSKVRQFYFSFFSFSFLKIPSSNIYRQNKITVNIFLGGGKATKFSFVRNTGHHAEIFTSMNFFFKIHT